MKKIASLLFLLAPLLYGADEMCVKHIVVPQYPRIAELARIQGVIHLEITISTGGKVLSVTSSGPPLLTGAAEENIKSWSFSQADPAAGIRTLKLKFDYVLNGEQRTVSLDLPNYVRITGIIPTVETNSAVTR